MKLPYRQRGLSTLSILVIVLVAIFFGTCAIKMIPAYIESATVKRAVEAVVAEASANNASASEMRSKMAKLLQVNMVEVVSPKDIKIKREKGVLTIDARYEKRLPLMFNIDVVIKFDQLFYEISGSSKK